MDYARRHVRSGCVVFFNNGIIETEQVRELTIIQGQLEVYEMLYIKLLYMSIKVPSKEVGI